MMTRAGFAITTENSRITLGGQTGTVAIADVRFS